MFCRIPPDGRKPGSVVIYRSRARWGKSVKILTVFVFALFGFIDLLLVGRVGMVYLIVLNIFFSAFLLGAYLFAPRAYEITQTGIVVRRILRSFEIPFSSMKRVYVRDLGLMSMRLFAMGGLFGFYGLYAVKGLGRIWVYVTRREKVVVIENRNKYAISPESNEEFLEILRKVVPGVIG